jgi:hypothetical protein
MIDTVIPCETCGSTWTRVLHEDDWKNCDCEDGCLIVCAEDGCL